MTTYFVTGLAATPTLVADAVRRVPPGLLDVPTHPDRFSPREVVAHLADWEPILFGRFKQAVEQPGSSVASHDEGKMAIEHGYSNWDVEDSLEKFAGARANTVAWLESLNPSQLTLFFQHPEQGEITVLDLAARTLGHDVYHLAQLADVVRKVAQ